MDLLLLLLLSSLSLSLDLLKKEKKSSGSILRSSLSLSPYRPSVWETRFWEKKKIIRVCTYLRVFSSDEKWEKVEKFQFATKRREREAPPIIANREKKKKKKKNRGRRRSSYA